MQILELKKALGTSSPVIKDECGDPNIIGKKGHVYVDGDGSFGPWFYIMAEGINLKNRLSFMIPWQGDCVFKLDRMPTEIEATIIRGIVGLRKKKTYSQETLDKMNLRLEKFRFKPRSSDEVS